MAEGKITSSLLYSRYMELTKTTSKPPQDVLAAVLLLRNHNIMVGDEKGNSNWNKAVTGAECLALFNKAENVSKFLTK